MEKIAIASDHAGRELKDDLVGFMKGDGKEIQDLGAYDDTSVDYPDFAAHLAKMVSTGEVDRGVLVCGTGVGMSIAANKFRNVRAALVGDVFTARMAKEHNNANVLVIGGRVTGKGLAREIINAWHNAEFEGGRHQKRLDKITAIEDDWSK